MSRNQWIILGVLGLIVAIALGCLGAALSVYATQQGLQPPMALPLSATPHLPRLVTFDNCLLGIALLLLGAGPVLWRIRSQHERARPTASFAPLYTCPICLAGPVMQTDKPRMLGLRTTRHFVCRACGSALEPAGDGYRYTAISTDHPDMKRHMGKVFDSWHELRNLAWAHPRRQLRADREAARWERQTAELSGERQEVIRKRQTDLPQTLEDTLESAPQPSGGPRILQEFIGQQKIKDKVWIAIAAAKARGEALGHILLRGPEGCGKRTLAIVIANEMGSKITVTSGPAVRRAHDLAAIITNLGRGDILFIDEGHRLSRVVEERLCPAMKDHALDIVIGKGPSAKTIHLPLSQFTVLCATDQPDRLSHHLRQHFEHVYDFEPYEVRSLVALVRRRAKVLGVEIDPEAALQIARAAEGRMREARRLLDRVRDYAQVYSNGAITRGVALDALTTLGIEPIEQAPEAAPPTPRERLGTSAEQTWQEFEDFVAELFHRLGYENVTLTSRAGDEGKDLVMELQSPLGQTGRVYVECKQWENTPVGRKEIAVLHSVVVADGVHEGFMVTTGRFTSEAVRYAKKVGKIRLIDGKKLRELMARAGLQMGDGLAAEEPRYSVQDEQPQPAGGERGAETVTAIGPATPPPPREEEPPKLTQEIEALLAALDSLPTWARRMFGKLDQIHENEPMLSAQHTSASLTSNEYRRDYSHTALRSLRSFSQVLDDAQECDDGLQTAINRWGPTKTTETSRIARQHEELAEYSSRYQQLFDEALQTYFSLRDVPPHPSLSDCHRDALEGMYYGLSWVLGRFVKYPAKEYDEKTLYITAEAPLGLVHPLEKKYLKLTRSAHGRLAAVAHGTAPR